MQPINPNNLLAKEHVFAVATSEGGKTSAIKKLFIKPADQVVFFDPFGDYSDDIAGRKVRIYYEWGEFTSAVLAGRKTKQGFKIAKAFKGETTPEDFERFAQIVWGCGNGMHTKPLKAVFEEVAEHSTTAGKATGYYGKILRVGRKFGLHALSVFQRGQEVSKTVFDNTPYKWIGLQETPDSAVYLSKKTGVPKEEIMQLDKLEYILKKPGKMDNWEKGKIVFR